VAVTDDQLKALGRLTAEFSWLEFMITYLTWKLTGDRASAMIFTSHLSFQHLCHAATALVGEKMKATPFAMTEMQEIIGRAMSLEGGRNRLIHSVWTDLPGAPGDPPPPPGGALTRLKITAKGRLDIQFQPDFPAQEISKVVDAIQKTALDVVLFMGRHGMVEVDKPRS
jgi:hypothetical protein